MRCSHLSCSLVLIWLAGSYACLCHGQQDTRHQTLEDLLTADADRPAVEDKPAVNPEPAEPTPVRPSGTLVRPEDDVRHPDLDKAWAEYDAAVAKAAERIKAAIAKQFNAAVAKGDLDTAEKCQAILKKFEKAGEMPTSTEAKAAVNAAVADFKKAKDKLAAAYESVVKGLTMEKKIAEAKAVRDQSRVVMAPEKSKDAASSPISRIDGQEKNNVVFLSDLEERHVNITAGHGWVFGKNGDNGCPDRNRSQIFVSRVASKKGLGMAPGPRGEMSVVTYTVPDSSFLFEGKAAMDDTSVGLQSMVIFEVAEGNRVLWRSRPLKGVGESESNAMKIAASLGVAT